jgi:hypothetical protein
VGGPDRPSHVIKIARSAVRGMVELEFVELETRGSSFVLRWRLRLHEGTLGLEQAAGPRGPELRYDVHDDLGTAYYEARPQKGGGTEQEWAQEDRFVPGLQANAEILTIRVESIELKRFTRDGPQPPKVWHGPWEFGVELRRA